MSIDCFDELFVSEFCDIIIFSCLLYNALLMSFPHYHQLTNLQNLVIERKQFVVSVSLI